MIQPRVSLAEVGKRWAETRKTLPNALDRHPQTGGPRLFRVHRHRGRRDVAPARTPRGGLRPQRPLADVPARDRGRGPRGRGALSRPRVPEPLGRGLRRAVLPRIRPLAGRDGETRSRRHGGSPSRADEREVTGLGDMLLGMNAHISRDPAVRAARVGPRDSRGAERPGGLRPGERAARRRATGHDPRAGAAVRPDDRNIDAARGWDGRVEHRRGYRALSARTPGSMPSAYWRPAPERDAAGWSTHRTRGQPHEPGWIASVSPPTW